MAYQHKQRETGTHLSRRGAVNKAVEGSPAWVCSSEKKRDKALLSV